ncbi:2,3-bisphosphoglycerate-dependent phosphoglycerate mutase [Buchnera aphidicola (Neophyllaphis podocarpi)]|uniref:2,3-diphosphoglycerate-dependent phosphoglycerate mutase n=1 Tax=Buchnera aphidicola TaxID=9 RepID=UPI0031B8255F
MKNIQIVLMRHGESLWNKENKFTGWCDIDLSNKGIEEAKEAAEKLKKCNFYFDIAYTSLLKRAINTLWYTLSTLDQLWIEVKKTWRLNERHYGNLQGLNKTKIAIQYGEKQLKLWRRGFNEKPPKINQYNKLLFKNDLRYKNIINLPDSESLYMTLLRVTQYWNKYIIPQLKKRKKIIIVAHGNSLRALIKYIEQIEDDKIIKLDIPTASPLIYELNEKLKPINKYYLK